MVDAETQRAVETALEELSEIERAVLVLYHQEECSYEGIAAALEMPINTVRTHLHRGRKKLGEMLRTKVQRQPVLDETMRKNELKQQGAVESAA
jgi:RNA polymerase sigma-70 factor (ECF subfamily)